MSKTLDKVANQTSVTLEDLAKSAETVEENREARRNDKTGNSALRFDEGTVYDPRIINSGVIYGD